MWALSIDYERRNLIERDVAEPVCSAGNEVLFRVREVGICGTDRELAAFRLGHGPEGDSYLIPGHEAVGEVIQTGSSVTGIRKGSIVVPAVRRPCIPACWSCARHRRDLCTSGRYTERGIFGAHGYLTELAVDREEDLVVVPDEISSVAVLVEPLSVVEKAVARAVELHLSEPATALVFGAGTIGLLAVMVLRLRGLDVDLVSVEAADSPRALLVSETGARYLTKPDRPADIVIEAAGVPEAASAALSALAPLGVLVILGAKQTARPAPLLDMIVGNHVVMGSVNASPEAFRQAVMDLGQFSPGVLNQMISRRGFRDARYTFLSPPPAAPKIVHVRDS